MEESLQDDHINHNLILSHFQGTLSEDKEKALEAHILQCRKCRLFLLGLFTAMGQFKIQKNKECLTIEVVDPELKERCNQDGIPNNILLHEPLSSEMKALIKDLSQFIP